MDTRPVIPVICYCILLSSAAGDVPRQRQERSVVSYILKYAIETFLSEGLGVLIDQIIDNDDVSIQLDNIERSLQRLEGNFQRSLASMEEIKERFGIQEALAIERKFEVFMKRFGKLVSAMKYLNNKNASLNIAEAKRLLREDVAKFTQDVKSIPDLLVELHSIIIGQGVAAAGRTPGLLCDFVSYSIRNLESNYNIPLIMANINNYRDALMRMQVNSFQLRNITCSPQDRVCEEERVELENHLEQQENRLQECIPLYLHILKDSGSVEDLRILDKATNRSLFIEQTSSIITDGIIEWDKITTPQPKGLRCSNNDTWTLIKGPNGYFLQYNDYCYLSFDKPFQNFKRLFPAIWADSDKIDRRDFLICLPNRTTDATLFEVFPTAIDRDTTYKLREQITGKYLKVQEKKTSVFEEIDKRLVLVLFLSSGNAGSWIFTDLREQVPCEGYGGENESEDNGIVLAIGITVAVVVFGIVLIAFIVWVYRNCKDNK